MWRRARWGWIAAALATLVVGAFAVIATGTYSCATVVSGVSECDTGSALARSVVVLTLFVLVATWFVVLAFRRRPRG